MESISKQDYDLIINTTPVGMSPNIDETPLPHYSFKPNQIVFDLIYTPMQTRLFKRSRTSRGAMYFG